MKVKELIAELKKIDGELDIFGQYSYPYCCGHPPGEYCYCSDETNGNTITKVELTDKNSNGLRLRKNEKQVVIFLGDSY